MRRATRVKAKGSWSGPAVDTVVLDYDARHRRRVRMSALGGFEFLLDLAEAVVLQDGDGLLLEDGRIVAVRAADEALMEVRARDPAHLLRLAWHVGNRHLPAELRGDCLRVRADHVIAGMLRGLGGEVTAISAPFQPEGGAYAAGHAHNHDHAHDHPHGHRHDHRH